VRHKLLLRHLRSQLEALEVFLETFQTWPSVLVSREWAPVASLILAAFKK
jgi:hypothetical protein